MQNGNSYSSTPDKENNRRHHHRKQYEAKINYTSDETFGNEYIRDISVRGVFIETAEEFTIGQILNLKIPYTNQEDFVNIKGKVVRIAPDGVGVEFLR